MITVYLNLEEEDKKMLSISGHAGYDESGKDVVCAAASAIFQTAILGLQALEQEYPDYVKIIL